ncbi:e3 ubiquitin-protein ligase RNF13 [Trichonephila clavipes]|nr:e3 ubiquitin-protein ligase RNF13 [Trichonephila clavipes]
MTLHTITPAVGAVCHSKAKTGLRRSPRGLHTRIRLSSLLRFNLDSRARVTKEDLVQSSFLERGTTPNGSVDGWASRAAHVMDAVIPYVLGSGTLRWFGKTRGPVVKVLPVSG